MRLKSILGSASKGDNGQYQFDWFGTRNRKNLARQTSEYLDSLNKYATSTDKTESDFLFASFANVKGMQDEAVALRNLVGDTDAYNKKLAEIRANKEAAIKSTTGFSAALKNLGGVAKTVGAALLQMGTMYVAGAIINAVVDWADHQINAVKYAKEALAEYTAEWDTLAEKQKTAGELVTKYESDYNRLSKGVNMVTGENLSLSDDEYELFKKINAELAESALSSVEGVTVAYDEQGNAIVRLSDQMDSLSDAYKQLEQQTRNEIIDDFHHGVVEKTQTALGASEGFVSNRAYLEFVQNILELARNEAAYDQYPTQAINTNAWARLFDDIKFDLSDTDASDESFVEQMANSVDEIAAVITRLRAEQSVALVPIQNGLRALMKNVWASDGYSGVSEQMQTLALNAIGRLGVDFYDQTSNEQAAWAESLAKLVSDSELQTTLERLYDLQKQFAIGGISYGDYMSRSNAEAQKFVSDEMPDHFEQLIMETFSLDGNSSYDRAIKRLRDIITDASEDWLNSLTSDQLNWAMSLDLNRPMTQDRFESRYAAYQQEKQYSASTSAKDYEKFVAAQATMQEIIEAQGHSVSITAEQYAELVEAGEEYANCVKSVNGYMQLDIEAAKELVSAKNAEAKATIEAGKAHKLQQYAENLQDLRYLNKVLQDNIDLSDADIDVIKDKIAALEDEQNVLRSDIDTYNRLGSEIAYATSAYKKWLDAQDAPEAGDAYESMLTAMKQIQEGQKSGKIGTAKYKAAVELLVPEGEDVQKYMKTLGKYLTKDSKGLQKFIDDMFAQGFLSKGSDGKYSFMQGTTVQDIAKGLGLTDELAQYMLQALQDYGWNVDLFNTEFDTDAAIKKIEAAAKQVELAEEEYNRIKNDAKKTAAEKEAAQKKLQAAEATMAAAEAELAAHSPQAKELTTVERLEADLERLQDLYDELGALELGGKVDEKFQQDIQLIQSVLQSIIEKPEGYSVSIDSPDESAVAVQRIQELQGALTAIEGLKKDGVISADVAAKLTGSLTDELTALQSEVDAYNSEQKKLSVTAALDDQASSEIQKIEDGTYVATIGVELDAQQKAEVEAQIAALREQWREEDKPQSEYPSPDTTHYMTSYQDQDYEVYNRRVPGTVDQYEPAYAYNVDTGEKIVGDALKALLDEIKREKEQKKVQQETEEKALPPETVDERTYSQKLTDMQAAMVQTSGDFDKALEKASLSIDDLVAAYRGKWASNRELSPHAGYVDEEYVRGVEQTMYSQSVVQQIADALHDAGGDLSEALSKLNLSYDQALQHYRMSGLSWMAPGGNINPAQATIDDFTNYLENVSGLEVLVGANTDSAESAVNAFVNKTNSKTATVTVKASLSGLLSGIGSVFGLNFARGTKNAPEEDAMVGEAGVETVISDGYFYTVGHNGPEIVHLNAGDQVLTNQETKRLFGGTPRKSGSAYQAGRLINRVEIVQKDTGESGAVTGNPSTQVTIDGDGGNINTNKTGAASISSILKQLEKLYDWIERALEVASKKTQDFIDSVKDFVGYIAQNKQVDKAIASTRNEIELNEQAYVRYMQQAEDVQKKLKLSDDIVQKIHEGTIDIESYDDTTKKKIAAYQEWYDKAEACKDAIKDLKDQEHELQLQRLDNIIADYDNRVDQHSDEIDRTQREIDLRKAIGAEVHESSYETMIDQERKKVSDLQRERAALEAEFNALVAEGVIQVGSEEWHKYRNEIEGIDAEINDAQISMAEFGDEIYNLRLDKLQAVADTLKNIQSNTEGIMSLHDAQGAKNTRKHYESLISNGHDQIANLEAQNALILEQMAGLDPASEKYQELLAELRANEKEINDIKISQEQWNDSIADLRIGDLEDQREAMEKTNDEYQKQLDYEEALEALAKAKSQRTKLVYREGVGFVYEADQDAIDAAQKRVDELEHQQRVDEIDKEIDAIEKSKADDNIWSYDGTQLVKEPGAAVDATTLVNPDGTMPDDVFSMLRNMLATTVTPEGTNAIQLHDGAVTTNNEVQMPMTFGDIYVTAAKNAEDLAKAIVENLPNAIIQDLNKH